MKFSKEIRSKYPNVKYVVSLNPYLEDDFIELTKEMGIQLTGDEFCGFYMSETSLWIGDGMETIEMAIKDVERYSKNK